MWALARDAADGAVAVQCVARLIRRRLAAPLPAFLFREMLSRASDRKTLFVEQALDFEDGLDIFATVEAVPAGAFHRLQRGKLGFPVAQHERLRRRQTAHLADAEKALFRKFLRGLGRTRHGL